MPEFGSQHLCKLACNPGGLLGVNGHQSSSIHTPTHMNTHVYYHIHIYANSYMLTEKIYMYPHSYTQTHMSTYKLGHTFRLPLMHQLRLTHAHKHAPEHICIHTQNIQKHIYTHRLTSIASYSSWQKLPH